MKESKRDLLYRQHMSLIFIFGGEVNLADLKPREQDALLAATKLDDEDPRFYRKLGSSMHVSDVTAKRYLASARKKLRAAGNGAAATDVVDIRTEMMSVCRKLDLVPGWVRRITITPKSVTAEVYLEDEHGQKHLKYEGGPVATETRLYTIIA